MDPTHIGYVIDPLIDQVADELLGRAQEVRVVDVVLQVGHVVLAFDEETQRQAFSEALVAAVGARLERRTNRAHDLVNVSTDDDPRVARRSPEAERLALERRAARKQEGKL